MTATKEGNMAQTFESLNLDPALIEGLGKQGITVPTPIQELAIPAALAKEDVVAEAHTGSGKTLAFLLPLFQNLEDIRQMQALILAPTHELVIQISDQARLLAKNSNRGLTALPLIGGTNIDKQIKKLRDKPQIVVGTPGRVLELIKKRKISAHTLNTIVLDEADSLLDNTNAQTIKDIIKSTLRDRKLWLFSASISDNTMELAKSLMKEPAIFKNEAKSEMNPNISHYYLKGDRRDKFDLLRKLIAAEAPDRALIFVNQNDSMQEIAEKLEFHKQSLYVMRGNIKKEERKSALEAFRKGTVKLLVSSDLTARGLDVPEISHIIHLDLPASPQEYLHRSGRTARGTASGKSISIITAKDLDTLKKFQKKFGIEIREARLSHGEMTEAASRP